MKIQNARLPDSTEVPGAERWADQLLAPRDSFTNTIATALQGLLSIDNANAEIRDLLLSHNTLAIVSSQRIRGTIIGALLLKFEHTGYAHLAWQPLDTNKVSLSVFFTVVPTAPVPCRILLIGT
jgi:hypothetical protein